MFPFQSIYRALFPKDTLSVLLGDTFPDSLFLISRNKQECVYSQHQTSKTSPFLKMLVRERSELYLKEINFSARNIISVIYFNQRVYYAKA